MSKIKEVRLCVSLAPGGKYIQARTSLTRYASDDAFITRSVIHEVKNSSVDLERFILGLTGDEALALDNDYFRMRFNVRELHGLVTRLEEISIFGDMDERIWRISTHRNGAFKVWATTVGDEVVIDNEVLTNGYSSCIRNITTLHRKNFRFRSDLEA